MSPSELFIRNVPGSTELLATKCVGIAGCGGLGSNAAVALARAGVGRLILADFDTVEPSNLNRQHYFQADIGRPKVDALADHLRAINPAIRLDLHRDKLTPENAGAVFHDCDLLIEAFDRAERKVWLTTAWVKSHPHLPMVMASGLSGLGATQELKATQIGRHLYLCGDGHSQMTEGLCAPRVAIAANMEANVAIELLVRGKLG